MEDARETAETLETVYTVLYDDGREVSQLYDIGSMPMIVLIDREGTVIYLRDTLGINDGIDEEVELHDAIESYLGS